MKEEIKIKVRVFPISAEKGPTLAFANATVEGLFAMRDIRVLKGKDGPFVSMPQHKLSNGKYQDICFLCTKEAQTALSGAVLAAYDQKLSEQTAEIARRLAGPAMEM